MKIIFDSEEQKEKFMCELSKHLCPSDFDLVKPCSPFSWHCLSEECWMESSLEVEVRE